MLSRGRIAEFSLCYLSNINSMLSRCTQMQTRALTCLALSAVHNPTYTQVNASAGT